MFKAFNNRYKQFLTKGPTANEKFTLSMVYKLNTVFPLINASLYLTPPSNKCHINKVWKWYKRLPLINAASITDSDAEDACQPFHLLFIVRWHRGIVIYTFLILLTITTKHDLFYFFSTTFLICNETLNTSL